MVVSKETLPYEGQVSNWWPKVRDALLDLQEQVQDGGGDFPGMVWREEWAVGTQYAQFDGVHFEGSAWIALISPELGAEPGPANPESWGLLAEKGVDGVDGSAATIAVGTVDSVASGAPATVTNSGTSSAAVFDFEIPAGADGVDGVDGAAATVAVGDVDTVPNGTPASVTNVGTSTAAVFDFEIPAGPQGLPGDDGVDGTDGIDGTNATVAVGDVDTVAYGSPATVTNVGTASAAVFDFEIPAGQPATGTAPDVKTADYTLVLGDVEKTIEMDSATSKNVTVPPNSSVAFPVGTRIEVVQKGAGSVVLVPGAGVTLRYPTSLTTRAQWSSLVLRKRATDEWVVSGDAL